jgi:nucleoside-diphosphate-sugar epimerase
MRYDLVVNSFIAKALTDKKLTVFGGDQERPFLHIQDIAYAIEHVIENDLRGVFNLRSENLNIKDLSEIIKQLTNCKIGINENIVDKRSYIVDNSKFKSTGFEFKHSIKDAIEELKSSPSIFNVEKSIYSNLKLAENLMISRSLKDRKIEVIKGDLAVDDRGKV